MENKKTCADCINLGREVYCMKCKRIKNGYKDLFVDAAPVQAKPPVVSKKVIGSGWHQSSASFLFSFELVQQTAFAAFFAVTLLGFNQLCLA